MSDCVSAIIKPSESNNPSKKQIPKFIPIGMISLKNCGSKEIFQQLKKDNKLIYDNHIAAAEVISDMLKIDVNFIHNACETNEILGGYIFDYITIELYRANKHLQKEMCFNFQGMGTVTGLDENNKEKTIYFGTLEEAERKLGLEKGSVLQHMNKNN